MIESSATKVVFICYCHTSNVFLSTQSRDNVQNLSNLYIRLRKKQFLFQTMCFEMYLAVIKSICSLQRKYNSIKVTHIVFYSLFIRRDMRDNECMCCFQIMDLKQELKYAGNRQESSDRKVGCLNSSPNSTFIINLTRFPSCLHAVLILRHCNDVSTHC